MNLRKIKIFFKFHWIGISVALFATLILISLAIVLRNAILAWQTSESYFKKAILAQSVISFYIWIVVYIISMPLMGITWMWIMRGGTARFTRLHKKAVSGEDIRIRWDDVIGMEESKEEAREVMSLVTD